MSSELPPGPVALVTGPTGQDGSYLCELLVSRGWTVHALVRDADRDAQPLPAPVVRVAGDLLDAAGVAAAIDAASPDAIFNLGGLSSVAASWEQPELGARINGAAVAGILDAALRLQDRLGRAVAVVQASSAEIFGQPERSPQDESTPIRPISPYGAAKAFAHDLVRLYRERGLAASSVILFNHESPRRPPAFVTRKITAGAAAIAAGRADRLVLGSLDAVRDWGWAPDYVEAMLTVATAGGASGSGSGSGEYVVATGVGHTVRDFVAAAFEAAGLGDWSAYVESDPALIRPADPVALIGDASRIRERLGWSPTVDFAGVVERMVAADLAALGVGTGVVGGDVVGAGGSGG